MDAAMNEIITEDFDSNKYDRIFNSQKQVIRRANHGLGEIW